MRAGVTLKK